MNRDQWLSASMAFFALGNFSIYYLLVPLWALQLDISPWLIGIAVGIRPVLPALLSIHAGALMDRLGVRTVLIATAIIGVLVPILMPLLPSVAMLFCLQLIGGLSEGLGWLGAQTRLAQVAQGDARAAGLFSMLGKAGTLVSPVILGLMWDYAGIYSAFAYTALWASAFLVSILLLPTPTSTDAHQRLTHWRDLLPRWADYRTAWQLLAIPVIAIIMITTFIRLGAFGVQASFYTVFLQADGFEATQIGLLVSTGGLGALSASLLAAPLVRWVPPIHLVLVSVMFGILGMGLTPLAPNTLTLVCLALLFGAGVGINLPVMLSLLSEVTVREQQGLTAGLRATLNRVGNIVIPVMMGIAVETSGLANSFYWVMASLLSILFVLWWFAFTLPMQAKPATSPSSTNSSKQGPPS